ncbi:hypothetical protein, partial [Bifidobacterium sp. UBA6881]|uniref:hypothetical protein n=1 Tax=Bifidobacterium sp. UBA6881 TaxID=1946109 RepID=UPI0025C1CBE8
MPNQGKPTGLSFHSAERGIHSFPASRNAPHPGKKKAIAYHETVGNRVSAMRVRAHLPRFDYVSAMQRSPIGMTDFNRSQLPD